MNYQEYIEKPSSNKEIFAHIEPSQKLNVWQVHSGSIYKKSVSHYVINAKVNTTDLTKASSSSLNSGEWFFDSSDFTLYVRLIDDSNPDESDLIVDYRIFISSMPYVLPFDMESGEEVYYEPLISSRSNVKFEIDDEQKGIALESSYSLSVNNTEGFFDLIYDTYVFEEKPVTVWAWTPELLLSDKKVLFRGFVKDKTFSDKGVKFSCKDFVSKLRGRIKLDVYSELDGTLDDFDLNKPKRRIYGQVQQVKTVGIDKILDGFSSSSSIVGVKGSNTISGSNFLQELSPEDKITITIENTEFEYSIESVDSDTTATISEQAEITFNSIVNIEPQVPYRFKNRKWHIGQGGLYKKSTTVSQFRDKARFDVVDASNIFANDLIKIGSEFVRVRRVSGNTIILREVLENIVSVGESVTKSPVSNVQMSNDGVPIRFVIDRDYNLINTATDSYIEFNENAEFNAIPERKFSFDLTFTDGSRSITTVENINFRTYFRTRDWIKSDDIEHATWYEILEVKEQELLIRGVYSGATTTTEAFLKDITFISDSTTVLVDTLGIADTSGEWVKTGPEVVKHLCENDAGLVLDESSFSDASNEIPYIISMVEPDNIGGGFRQLKNIIKDVNDSILGSLHNDVDFNIVYNVIDARKPELTEELKDDDIISWSVTSKNKILRKVVSLYRPFIDKFSTDATFKRYEFVNEFVDRLVGTDEEKEVKLFLYEDSKAETMAQRIGFYNSLSSSIVNVKTKLNLSLKSLNDKIWLNLDRLYRRFGQSSKMKIGIINKISKDGRNTEVSFNDLGNIFNRSLNIAPNDAVNYSSADDEAKLFNGHIVDNLTELPDNNTESGYTQRLS